MDLFLQFGHGMMKLCQDLIEKWDGGTVILSPRDQSYEQMVKFSNNIKNQNGRVVIDPQFYLPHADHGRLTSHEFWPTDYQTALFSESEVCRMLSVLKDNYNDAFDSSFFILPCQYSSLIDDDWYRYHSLIIDCAKKVNIKQPIYFTLCLSHETISSEEQIHLVLEYLETWDIDGCYIVAEPPGNSYLVENPVWMMNIMDLCAGVKRLNKKVVVGYCNHQMLCLALSQVDAIASGNWLNVRSFNLKKFNIAEEGISRRSTWYYCPQALSEYQIPFLDIAHRFGIIDELLTNASFGSTYSNILFSGAQPSAVNFPEGDAFRHYLQCLKVQANNSVKYTYLDTKESLRIQLVTANMLISDLSSRGINGRDRDFSKVLDINLSAINAFHQIRGMTQDYYWNTPSSN